MGRGNGMCGRAAGGKAGEAGMGQVMRGWMCCANEIAFCPEGREQLLKKSLEGREFKCLKKFT